MRDKRGRKKYNNKNKYKQKESNNNEQNYNNNNVNNYYGKGEAFSGSGNKFFNSKSSNINNDRQLFVPNSNSSKDNYYNQNPIYKKDLNDNNSNNNMNNNNYSYNNQNYNYQREKKDNSYKYNNNYNYNNKPNFINSSNKNINNDTKLNKQKGKNYNYNYQNKNYNRQQFNQQDYQPKKFFGKINFSSNEQFKVTRPYDFVEKTEKIEEFAEKKVFFNSKIDLNKESNLKELDTKEDLFLNKFIKATSSTSLNFSSSNENSLQNMPFVNSKKEKKEKEIEINYRDMEVENRNDLEINKENKEKNEN